MEATPMNSILSMVIYFAVILGFFWLIIIRPQRKQEKAHREMLSNLQPGDQEVTIGGIKGKIIKIKEDNIILRVSSNVDIDFVRNSISRVEKKAEVKDNKSEELIESEE